MKKLLLLITLTASIFALAQPTINGLSSGNVTATSAEVTFYAAPNCANGAAISIQYANNASFSQALSSSFSITTAAVRTITLQSLTPGTLYYWRIYGIVGNNCGGQSTTTAPQSFTTLGAIPPPVISNIYVTTNATASATISYTQNANGSATSSLVRYGTDPDLLNNQATGSTAAGTVNMAGSATLTVLALNTMYYYKVEATNASGTTVSTVASFLNLPAQSTQEYTFDNTYSNTLGGFSFVPNAGTSFTADRNGNANSAININNMGAIATIPGLSYGISPRTVSLWVKMNSYNSNYNFIYCYGAASGYNGSFITTTTTNHFGAGSNHAIAIANTFAWTHYVFTFDGTYSRIYKDGVLLGAAVRNWNSANNNDVFTLGLSEQGSQTYFNGAIDDLKIYNFAASDAQVANLYNNNSLANAAFSIKNNGMVLYPNPATGSFSIEMANEVKSVKIYSLQGQQIMETAQKAIDISSLSKGIYLVNITDVNNHSATQKLIVE